MLITALRGLTYTDLIKKISESTQQLQRPTDNIPEITYILYSGPEAGVAQLKPRTEDSLLQGWELHSVVHALIAVLAFPL